MLNLPIGEKVKMKHKNDRSYYEGVFAGSVDVGVARRFLVRRKNPLQIEVVDVYPFGLEFSKTDGETQISYTTTQRGTIEQIGDEEFYKGTAQFEYLKNAKLRELFTRYRELLDGPKERPLVQLLEFTRVALGSGAYF